MFRTLVDLESTEQFIWHKVLGDKYTEALAKECSSHIGNQLLNYVPVDKYLSLKSVFVLIFTNVFSRLGIDINPTEAAFLWAQLHPESKPFHDTIPFLHAVGNYSSNQLLRTTDINRKKSSMLATASAR